MWHSLGQSLSKGRDRTARAARTFALSSFIFQVVRMMMKWQVSPPWDRAGCLAAVIHCPLDAHNHLQPFVQQTHTTCIVSAKPDVLMYSTLPSTIFSLSAHRLYVPVCTIQQLMTHYTHKIFLRAKQDVHYRCKYVRIQFVAPSVREIS